MQNPYLPYKDPHTDQNQQRYSALTPGPSMESISSAFMPGYYTLPTLGDCSQNKFYNGLCGAFYDVPLSVSFPSLGTIDICSNRRKNATRETTSILKRWLNEHRKNPYPTKSEKIMLSVMTKMSLTQVSTWFANARRRLKKENKMTWEPKSRLDVDEQDLEAEAEFMESDEKDIAYLTNTITEQNEVRLKSFKDGTKSDLNKRKHDDSTTMEKSQRKRVKFSSVADLAISDCVDNQPKLHNFEDQSLNCDPNFCCGNFDNRYDLTIWQSLSSSEDVATTKITGARGFDNNFNKE